jgi:hypothetical protein
VVVQFLYDCPRLLFENFQPDNNSETQPKVRVRLTKCGAQDLMRSLVAEVAVPALQDTVLPLRNRGVYLRAIADNSNRTPGTQALELTLRRIDEFLLIYSSRFMDHGQSAVMSMQTISSPARPDGVNCGVHVARTLANSTW